MARNTKAGNEGYNDILPKRIRELKEQRGVSQKKLAEVLDTTPQNISLYENGLSKPSWISIIKLAIFFHVSTDYLLGIEPEPTPDPEMKAMCKYLGLSEAAIQNLHNEARGQYGNIAIDAILSDRGFSDFHGFNYELFLAFASCILSERDSQNRVKPGSDPLLVARGLGGLLTVESMAEYDIYQAKQTLERIIKKYAASVQIPSQVWNRYGLERDPREIVPMEPIKTGEEEANGPHTED